MDCSEHVLSCPIVERYQLSGGEGSARGGWQAEFEGMQAGESGRGGAQLWERL